AGQARQDGEPVVEAAYRQDAGGEEAVQRRPDPPLVQVVEQVVQVAVPDVGGEFQAVEVVGVAVVGAAVPQKAVDAEEAQVQDGGQQDGEAGDEGRQQPGRPGRSREEVRPHHLTTPRLLDAAVDALGRQVGGLV